VYEVPCLQPSLLILDHQDAFTGEHEEILLVGLGVVEPARLFGTQYLERESDLGEPLNGQIGAPAQDRRVGLEDASGSERVVGQPRRVAYVDHEPAIGHRRKARAHVFEGGFLDHGSPS
jgi:hypothetical protein